MANRRNTGARSTRGANEDGRQLSFVVREPDAALPNDPGKLALHIPPPRSPVSAVRRLDLAARWAMDLGELAAELVAEGKLEVEQDVRGSTIPVVLAACRAGAGIAAVAELFAARDPGLTRVLPGVALPSREAWIVSHPDLRRSARIVAVTAWITSALASRRTRPGSRTRAP